MKFYASGAAAALAWLSLPLALSGPAAAQVLYNTPPSTGPSNLGGGFIELLATGQNPTVRPVSYRGSRYAPPADIDPFYSDQGYAEPDYGPPPEAAPSYRGRPRGLSALPLEPDAEPYQEETGISRAIDPRFSRQTVAYDGRERPGTIVIDTNSKFLYLVQPGGRAIRYGIGVGRPGFEWAGVKTVSMKKEWPSWTPPAEMLKRRPDLPRHMAGGPANPLGARALYLGSTLYRIHGTNEPHTIGRSVSSGCIRMMNQDVIDLYNRVPVGARVIVS